MHQTLTGKTGRDGQVQDPQARRPFPDLRLPLTVLLAFNGGLLALLVLRHFSNSWIVGIDNCAQFAGTLIVLPWAFGGPRTWHAGLRGERNHAGLRGWAPVCLGAGALCFGLGQLIWAWYEIVRHQ